LKPGLINLDEAGSHQFHKGDGKQKKKMESIEGDGKPKHEERESRSIRSFNFKRKKSVIVPLYIRVK
jgi:hypothetical protein